MKFGFSMVLLFFAVFAFPGFAEEVRGPKESLPCELGYEALYQRAQREFGYDKEMHGSVIGQIEYFFADAWFMAYGFTLPSHPAYPAVVHDERYIAPGKPDHMFRVAGCSYGNKAAFEKLLGEVEEAHKHFCCFCGTRF